jgi:hypothetical protein
MMFDVTDPSAAEAKKAAEPEREPLHAFATDYLKQDGPKPGMLAHRAFHVMYVPRLILACRVLGHRAVVDGTEGTGRRPGYRWVCCDRCGLRTDPQGDLDAERWSVGDVYDAELPGPWPRATGGLSAEVVVGKNIPGASISVAVGSAGDENTLAAHVRLSPLGAVYVHTEQFGTWLQRRLNPTGYDTRVVEAGIGDGRLHWRIWAKQNEHSTATSRWRDGSVVVDPRDRLLGELRYSYEPVGEPVTAVVRMPEGDDHEVTLTLQRVRRGRRRGTGKLSWSADWSSEKGIPFRRNSWKGNEVGSSSVDVSDAAVDQGRWAEEACAAIAVRVSAMRTRYRWRAEAMADGED